MTDTDKALTDEANRAHLKSVHDTWVYIGSVMRQVQIQGDPVVCQTHLNALKILEEVRAESEKIIARLEGEQQAEPKQETEA